MDNTTVPTPPGTRQSHQGRIRRVRDLLSLDLLLALVGTAAAVVGFTTSTVAVPAAVIMAATGAALAYRNRDDGTDQ